MMSSELMAAVSGDATAAGAGGSTRGAVWAGIGGSCAIEALNEDGSGAANGWATRYTTPPPTTMPMTATTASLTTAALTAIPAFPAVTPIGSPDAAAGPIVATGWLTALATLGALFLAEENAPASAGVAPLVKVSSPTITPSAPCNAFDRHAPRSRCAPSTVVRTISECAPWATGAAVRLASSLTRRSLSVNWSSESPGAVSMRSVASAAGGPLAGTGRAAVPNR